MGDNMTDFNSRVLCSDGTCIGVIGAGGKCKECGKPQNRHEHDVASGKEKITKINKSISDISTDEKSFKCKTCGFFAFGDDPSTAKHKKCLGCGNIMGQELIKKQISLSNESLLETCQNCKHQLSKRASICPKCNQERTTECCICKKQIPQSSKSCLECGDPTPFEQQCTEEKRGICDISHKEKLINTVSISAVNSQERVQCAIQEKSIPKATHSNNYSNSNIEFAGTIFGWFWRGLLTIKNKGSGKLIWKIILSMMYPLLTFIISVAIFTLYAKESGSVTLAARLTGATMFVILPVFFYSLWCKTKGFRVTAIQIFVGTIVALILRVVFSIGVDVLFIKTFSLQLVHICRIIGDIFAVIISIYAAIYIGRKTSIQKIR